MSVADKMFEELGYKLKPKTTYRSYYIKYYKDNDNVIYFNEDRSIVKSGEYSETCYGFTMAELKAIFAKLLELGWI